MQNPTEVKLKLNMLCVASLRVLRNAPGSSVGQSSTLCLYSPRILGLKSEKSVNRLCLMLNQNVIHLSLKHFTQSFIPKLFCQSSLIPLIICPVIPYPIKEVNGKHIYPILQLETLIAHNS